MKTKLKFFLIVLTIHFHSLAQGQEEALEERKLTTRDVAMKNIAVSAAANSMALLMLNRYEGLTGRELEEAAKEAGFSTKMQYDREMAFAKKSDDCLKKMRNANANSRTPVRYYGDSSSLMIHVKGSKIQIYSPDGMLEVDGSTCKSFDKTKNVVDGLVAIAERNVKSNTVGISESPQIQKAQSKRIKDMLQVCGEADSKFEQFARQTLKEKYKTVFKGASVEFSDGLPAASTTTK